MWSPKIPINIKGFKLELLKRTSKRGGELGVYVKENTKYKIIEGKITTNWEVQILVLKAIQNEIMFINTYIPQKKMGKIAMKELTETKATAGAGLRKLVGIRPTLKELAGARRAVEAWDRGGSELAEGESAWEPARLTGNPTAKKLAFKKLL